MPSFSNSRIYKLVNDVDNKIYVGSTTQPLHQRFSGHKRASRSKPNRHVYQHITAIGGFSHVRIIQIEEFKTCENKNQLIAREQHYIDLLKPELNKRSAYAHCPHNRQKSWCKDCGGSSICSHGKRKSRCKLCKGVSICSHDKQKSQCKLCNIDKYYCKYCDKSYCGKSYFKRHQNSAFHIYNFINY